VAEYRSPDRHVPRSKTAAAAKLEPSRREAGPPRIAGSMEMNTRHPALNRTTQV
jgi:hypothetical protein